MMPNVRVPLRLSHLLLWKPPKKGNFPILTPNLKSGSELGGPLLVGSGGVGLVVGPGGGVEECGPQHLLCQQVNPSVHIPPEYTTHSHNQLPHRNSRALFGFRGGGVQFKEGGAARQGRKELMVTQPNPGREEVGEEVHPPARNS